MTHQITNVLQDVEQIDLKRYRKIRCFFAKIFLQTIWWDIFLNRPVLRWLRTPAVKRWQLIARKYRFLAMEMGGVLIKLGQFLSIRVDIFPIEVTRELTGLQDNVLPEKTELIISRIEKDFGCPISDIFDKFYPHPLGAASLAQAHQVRLHTGEDAVVKVLRPGIDVLVKTDLAAINLAFRWLKFYKKLTQRVDIDWLAQEFSAITTKELDFKNEVSNALRLEQDFAEDQRVYIPKIYKKYCTAHILTLENVGYIKIGDLKAIEAAGISRVKVADKLYSIYMQQVFETHFVHVDPHPGNLFVRPLPFSDEYQKLKPGDYVPYRQDRPFQIVFIDFGMMAAIPERLKSALREYAVGLGTRDAHKIIQAYINAGTLLPGADLKRLEEIHQAFFEHFWGTQVGKLKDTILKQAGYFMKEYRDIIQEAPFQFQADMLFVVRAIGILSGMAANLDPKFDVWSKTIPFARRYAKEALKKDGVEYLKELTQLFWVLSKIPEHIEKFFIMVQQDKLTIQTGLAGDTRKAVINLNQSIRSLGKMILCGAMIISSVILYVDHKDDIGWIIMAVMAFLMFFWSVKQE